MSTRETKLSSDILFSDTERELCPSYHHSIFQSDIFQHMELGLGISPVTMGLSIFKSRAEGLKDLLLGSDTRPTSLEETLDAPVLSPFSSNAMNTLNSRKSPSLDSPKATKQRQSTIRSVPSESLHIDTDSADEGPRRQSRSDSSKSISHIPVSHPPPLPRPTSNLIFGTNVVRKKVSLPRNLNVPDDFGHSANTNGNTVSPNSGGPGGTQQVGFPKS